MKNLTINANVEGFVPVNVKSVNLMWINVKEIFANFPAAEITVVDEAGNDFKKLKLVDRKNGKKWMYNSVDETKRVKVKAVKEDVKEPEVETVKEDVKEPEVETVKAETTITDAAKELDEIVKGI